MHCFTVRCSRVCLSSWPVICAVPGDQTPEPRLKRNLTRVFYKSLVLEYFSNYSFLCSVESVSCYCWMLPRHSYFPDFQLPAELKFISNFVRSASRFSVDESRRRGLTFLTANTRTKESLIKMSFRHRIMSFFVAINNAQQFFIQFLSYLIIL
jgi:hypothetical protein